MSALAETQPVAWADPETLRHVRPAVRRVLESTPAFAELEPAEQERLAREMVKVCTYMANPEGLTAEQLGEGEPLAREQADAAEATKQRLSKDPGFAGQDFEGGAIKEGVEQFGELVKKVDFPAFVAGLIQGVFKAIVDSSMEQMKASGELIANVAKSVDDFAKDNISENNARDWLTERFPDKLGLDESSTASGFADGDPVPTPTPKVTVTAEDPDAALAEIARELNMAKPPGDLSDENQELELVLAARREIARGRQQLLASMVMLGMQRIVVTDGLINAKVVFDMRASDQAARASRASMYDRASQSSSARVSSSYSSWFSPVKVGYSAETRNDHVATVQSSVEDTSESKAEVKAKLTGEVRVNFKSDYLPLEKMATPEMIGAIQGNAAPPQKAVAGA